MYRNRSLIALPLMLVAGLVKANTPIPSCTAVPQALPQAPAAMAAVASELYANTTDLGTPAGVLSQTYDPSLSVDQVLLRMRIEACRVAVAVPAPSPVSANDPAAYQPKTAHDNTPWRFNMTQNGRRMTADEFDAWMKARGVRIATGRPAQASASEGATSGEQGGQPAPANKP
ncbi:hypothetical protein CO614_10200 [Lysobacteraceae bacterium NML120232]|nr:hypothetical protein CO614_10200 [Xanthomonadaceae bacterium NML120232]PJK10261.1 hypothetical protein CO608_06235 [Xanthomonadaceae bacterium NML08-0793]